MRWALRYSNVEKGMYPVGIGYTGAIARINELTSNGHHAEALVTSVFTVEKTLRRTLRQLIVSAGFRSTISEKIVKDLRGLDSIKKAWEFYDASHRLLPDVVGNADWKKFQDAATMRNKLIHGERVYKLDDCQQHAADVLAALDRVKAILDREYGYSGWEKLRIRKRSRLHIEPLHKGTQGSSSRTS